MLLESYSSNRGKQTPALDTTCTYIKTTRLVLQFAYRTYHCHTAIFKFSYTRYPQVVTVYRLLETVPAVAIAAFTQHELAQCAAARRAIAEPVQQQQQQLLQQFDRHRRALHPTMVQPSRY